MKKSSFLFFGLVALASLPTFASEPFFVQVPAMLDPAAPIADSVKRECGIELLVGNHVFQKVSDHFGEASPISDLDKAGANRLLQLSVLSVQGVGGGSWSGPKAITIRAQLSQTGKTTQTTVLRRKSSGGAFGGMSGTCSIMERIAIALGKDVATWLKATTLASTESPSKPMDTLPTPVNKTEAISPAETK